MSDQVKLEDRTLAVLELLKEQGLAGRMRRVMVSFTSVEITFADLKEPEIRVSVPPGGSAPVELFRFGRFDET